MNRPNYEALDGQGLPYIRQARVVGELPTPSDRLVALASASKTLAGRLHLQLHQSIRFGTAVHLAFGLTRQQAKQHSEAKLLLTRGDDISLDQCPEYN